MRLLLTGGSSYLGQHLVPLARQCLEQEDKLLYTYFCNDPLRGQDGQYLDIRDEAAVAKLVDDFCPDAIIHMAGSNRPAETMDEVIRLGATHITRAAARHRARLIHLSTDVVFDGRHPPYVEEDPPRPIFAYGRAKAAAETIVASHDDHVVVRTSLLYGLEQMDRGTGWVVAALEAGEPVTLFTNQIRNPAWVVSLSRACLELLTLPYQGILHVAGAQRLSRAEFGLRMMDWWKVEARDELSFGPCDGERWPLDVTLDINRASSLLQTPLPGVDQVLRQVSRA